MKSVGRHRLDIDGVPRLTFDLQGSRHYRGMGQEAIVILGEDVPAAEGVRPVVLVKAFLGIIAKRPPEKRSHFFDL